MARFSTAAKALRGPFKKLATKLGLVLRKPKDLLRNLRAAAATRAAARRRSGGFTRAGLIAGAEAPDRNGLTRAGRALQKHGGRDASVFWSMASGVPKVGTLKGSRLWTRS